MVRKGAELPAAQCGRYYLIKPHPRGRGAEPLRRAAARLSRRINDDAEGACESSRIRGERVSGAAGVISHDDLDFEGAGVGLEGEDEAGQVEGGDLGAFAQDE